MLMSLLPLHRATLTVMLAVTLALAPMSSSRSPWPSASLDGPTAALPFVSAMGKMGGMVKPLTLKKVAKLQKKGVTPLDYMVKKQQKMLGMERGQYTTGKEARMAELQAKQQLGMATKKELKKLDKLHTKMQEGFGGHYDAVTGLSPEQLAAQYGGM